NSCTRGIAIFTRSAGDGFVAYSVGHGHPPRAGVLSSWQLDCIQTCGRVPSNGSNVWAVHCTAAATKDSVRGLGFASNKWSGTPEKCVVASDTSATRPYAQIPTPSSKPIRPLLG